MILLSDAQLRIWVADVITTLENYYHFAIIDIVGIWMIKQKLYTFIYGKELHK